MNDRRDTVRLHVSAPAYVAGMLLALLFVGMTALLVMQLTVLRDTRERIHATDQKIALLLDGTRPVVRDAQPALEEAQPLLHRTRGLIGPLRQTIESVGAAADGLPVLLANARVLVDESVPLVRALNADDRAVRAIDTTTRVLSSIEGASLVPKLSSTLDRVPRFEDLAVDLLQTQRRTLKIQIRSLRAQQRSVRLLFQSLAIQRETLSHTRSIDRKTGGELPAAPPTTLPRNPSRGDRP